VSDAARVLAAVDQLAAEVRELGELVKLLTAAHDRTVDQLGRRVHELEVAVADLRGDS
jgi:hypothetical protein